MMMPAVHAIGLGSSRCVPPTRAEGTSLVLGNVLIKISEHGAKVQEPEKLRGAHNI